MVTALVLSAIRLAWAECQHTILSAWRSNLAFYLFLARHENRSYFPQFARGRAAKTRTSSMTMRHILTLNAGSSSIKFALFEDAAGPVEILRGQVEGLGTATPHLKIGRAHV